jgi:predicted aspartyl protease
LQTYDGTSSWLDYKYHFDACSRINQWSENEKRLYLAVALRGQAQGILGDLSIDKQQNYKSLVKALEERFAPLNQTELYRVQLTERRQKPAESLPDLGQAIRRLVNLVYPTVPENVRDTLAKQHLIEALAESEMRIRIKHSRPQNLNDAIRLAVELETFNRAERRVTEGHSYLRTTAADSTAGKVSDKTKDQTDMMKLMTYMQKRLSDLQRDVNQLKNEKFGPRTFDNTSRFNYGRGQAYGQNYGRGHGYRQHFNRGQDNRQNGYRVNPQKENSQTDKKSENVGRGRGRARPLRSEVKTNQSSIQGSIGVSSAAQEAGMYAEADIHQVKCELLVDTGATVSIVSNDIYQKIPEVARPTQEVLTATGDKLKIVGRGNFLMRLDDTKDMVVQALVAQITVDGIIGSDCLRSNAGLIDLQNSMLEVDGRRESLKYAGKLGCFRVVAHDKVVMPAQSEMIIRGAVDDSANKLTYETDMLVEANETFLKKDKALVGVH